MLNWLLRKLVGLELRQAGELTTPKVIGMSKIPKIRLWTLGDIDNGVYPEQREIDKVYEKLKEMKNGEDFDIVWGPELKVVQL